MHFDFNEIFSHPKVGKNSNQTFINFHPYLPCRRVVRVVHYFRKTPYTPKYSKYKILPNPFSSSSVIQNGRIFII